LAYEAYRVEDGQERTLRLRTALIACWSTWLLIFSHRMLMPTLMPVIKLDLGLTEAEASLMISLLFIGYAASQGASGFIAQMLSDEVVVASLLLAASLSYVLVFLASSPQWLMAGLLAAGLSQGLYIPPAISLLSRLSPPDIRGRVLGIHETAAPVGQVLGPVAAGLMLSTGLSWRHCVLPWIASTLLLSLVFLAARGPHECRRRGAGRVAKLGIPIGLYLALLTSLVCMSAGLGLVVMMPLYMSSFFGLSAALAAFIVGASRATGVLGQLLGGFLSDRLGRMRVLLATTATTAASTLVLVASPYGPAFTSSLFIAAASQTAFFPVFFAFIADVSEEEARARLLSLLMAPGLVLGSGLTPYVIGWLAENYGYPIALLYPLALSFISIPAVVSAWLAARGLSTRAAL